MNAADGGTRRCILVTNNEVNEKTADRLRKRGVQRRDPEYESQGVFEAVARPRIEAAVTGRLPDGEPVRGSYLDGRLYAGGFDENVEFFRLDYLTPIASSSARATGTHPVIREQSSSFERITLEAGATEMWGRL